MVLELNRTLILANRVLTQNFRDKRTVGMIFMIPIIVTIIYGYALSGEIVNVRVEIVIDDSPVEVSLTSPLNPLEQYNVTIYLGGQIYEYLQDVEEVKLYNGTAFEQAKSNVDSEKRTVAIHIGENFTSTLIKELKNETTATENSVTVYNDGTKPSLVQAAMFSLQEAINATLYELSSHFGKNMISLDVNKQYANDISDLSQLEVTVPGIMAFIANFFILLFSTLMLVRERTYGTRERLLTTPLRPYEIIMGYSLALMVVALLMSVSILVSSVLVFNITIRGDIFELFLAITIFGISFVFLGIFLSNFARNELQAVQMAPLTAIPSMALSGFLVPIEILPSYLQPIADFLPLTYGIKLFRGIMLKGYSILSEQLLFDFLVVVFFSIVFLILAVVSIRGTLD